MTDQASIADLMTGWIHRDLAQWDRLRGLFHPDGTIEVTWFEGPFNEFVDRSMRMGRSDLRTKHFIGSPVATFNGERAIVETNAIIVGDNARLDLGCQSHNRFYDWVERRDGQWKIVKRQSIYDMASFTFPGGMVEIDRSLVERHPREYGALAYLLEKTGFPVRRRFATKGSELEQAMKDDGQAWLAG